MKLENVLDRVGALEKNSFLKIVDNIITNNPKNAKQIDRVLSDQSRDLKGMDTKNIVEIFSFIQNEFRDYLKEEMLNTTSQLDLLSDILIRDGNSKIKLEWFARLYEDEIKSLNRKAKEFSKNLYSESSDLSPSRQRDYKIYKACLETAYTNDDDNNQSRRISWDEQSILNTLTRELSLSHEELKLINSLIIKLEAKQIQYVINELKLIGVVFYSKKLNTIFVADEVVRILRQIRGKDVSDKHFRRVLRLLKPSLLNQVCKEHGLNWRGTNEERIREIIESGVSLRKVLEHSVHKEGTNLTDKKKFVNELAEKGLKLQSALRGTLLEEKVSSLLGYFEEIENDEKLGISIEGYESLLNDIHQVLPKVNEKVKTEFQFQDQFVLNHEYLLDFNIKPRDILELMESNDIQQFCTTKNIKTRGDLVLNVLDFYKDAESLYIENYEHLGFRNLKALNENGIVIHDSSIGVKFEEITKKIFADLGFNVDEQLRKKLSNKKNQIDLLINLGGSDVLLVECKTLKEKDYNKFSSISRQLKAYSDEIAKNDYKVVKTLIVAPEFSDDFIKDCDLHYSMNISLLKASSMKKIHSEFKKIKLKTFPHNLLMRDIVIDENRILKALTK